MIMAEVVTGVPFDPTVHIMNSEAAQLAGYAPKYFAFKLSRAYKLTRYTDGRYLYYDMSELNAVLEKMKERRLPSGVHKRGKLPKRTRGHYVQSVRTTRAQKKFGTVKTDTTGNGTSPDANSLTSAPKVVIVADINMVKRLIKEGFDIEITLK